MEHINDNPTTTTIFLVDHEGYFTGACATELISELTEDMITTPPRYSSSSPVVNKWNTETKQWDDVLTDNGRERLWYGIKLQRNELIAETDWTQCADVPFSEEKKQEMLKYRQALRDLTTTYSDPRDVEWPIKPF